LAAGGLALPSERIAQVVFPADARTDHVGIWIGAAGDAKQEEDRETHRPYDTPAGTGWGSLELYADLCGAGKGRVFDAQHAPLVRQVAGPFELDPDLAPLDVGADEQVERQWDDHVAVEHIAFRVTRSVPVLGRDITTLEDLEVLRCETDARMLGRI